MTDEYSTCLRGPVATKGNQKCDTCFDFSNYVPLSVPSNVEFRPICYGMFMEGPDASERDCDNCSAIDSCSLIAKRKREGKPASLTRSTTAVDPHAPGAKLDQGKTRPSLIFSAMPHALMAVAEVGTFGANKYSENGWMQVPNGIARYTDAMDRHRLAEAMEGPFDSDSGLKHAAHLAWNALARLELMLTKGESK